MICAKCNLAYSEISPYCSQCRMFVTKKQTTLKELAWMPLFVLALPGIFGATSLFLGIFITQNENALLPLGAVAVLIWTGYMFFYLHRTLVQSLFLHCENCESSSSIPIFVCPRCSEMNVKINNPGHFFGLLFGFAIMWVAIVMDLYILGEIRGLGFLRDMCFILALIATAGISIPLLYMLNTYKVAANKVAQFAREGYYPLPGDGFDVRSQSSFGVIPPKYSQPVNQSYENPKSISQGPDDPK